MCIRRLSRQKARRSGSVQRWRSTRTRSTTRCWALLYLTLHDHWRAWKGFDWDALDRLYQKGLIDDPVNKAKSVVFTEEGLKRAEELFRAMFTKPD